MASRMPVLFMGHGNPMNAVQENIWTRGWKDLGGRLPRPSAVLAVSAHWYVGGTAVTTDRAPRTIHDFGGFPRELYRISYPAPGDPALCRRVSELLSPVPVRPDGSWGLDHGTWSLLVHLLPAADVPVVQLSIDEGQPPEFHLEAGRRLAPLRDEGVLILGSGNLVHNLHTYAWGRPGAEPFDWALTFESRVRERMLAGDHAALAAYSRLGPEARLSVPTPEHYLPLLYAAGARGEGEPVSFPVEGIDGGSVSMLTILIGDAPLPAATGTS